MQQILFSKKLMKWHVSVNKRTMPWKGEKDAYKIWLSEIILQQTRVEQGLNYYERLVEKYPTIQLLAQAKDEDVFKLWEGLGYYKRCKNLLFTARVITEKFKGKFPETWNEILALKGVGNYTAAAIASFAFNLPHAVVDGNVFRVLSRIFAIDTPIDSTQGKKFFSNLANEVLDKKKSALYNQAIMDFGATVCKPVHPVCKDCVMNKICKAYQNGIVNELPVKEKILQRKTRWFYYFIFLCDDKIMVHQRTQKDIWEHLFEFYLVENESQMLWNDEAIKNLLSHQLNIKKYELQNISPIQKQELTHRQIKGQFIQIKLLSIPASLLHHQWIPRKQLSTLAFPKFINQFFRKFITAEKN
jgi:A/G-specific adenine glycosylase